MSSSKNTQSTKKKSNRGLFSCFSCTSSSAFNDNDDQDQHQSRPLEPSRRLNNNNDDSRITSSTGTNKPLTNNNTVIDEKEKSRILADDDGQGGAKENEATKIGATQRTTILTDTTMNEKSSRDTTTNTPVTETTTTMTNGNDPTSTMTKATTMKNDNDEEEEEEKKKEKPIVLNEQPTTGTTQIVNPGIELPVEETEGVTSGAVMAPGKEILPTSKSVAAAAAAGGGGASTGGRRRKRQVAQQQQSVITQVEEPGVANRRAAMLLQHDDDESDDDDEDDEDDDEEEEEDEEQSLIARGGVGIPIGEDGLPHPLLDELSTELKGRKCLVLDLDETLVHSSFKMVHQADYVVPVEIENQYHNVYVIKRPGVDAFLKAMGEIYEIVIFTASLSKYADPVLDQLDIHRVVQHRLFRESCYNNKGNYVKDLSQLGRPMSECIIIDNSPASYVFHVNNAVPISSWFNDPHDTELTDLVPFLTDLGQVDDIRSVLDAGLYQHLGFVESDNNEKSGILLA